MIIKTEAGRFNLSCGTSIAIPIRRGNNTNAYYLPGPDFKTIRMGDFVGNVSEGGSCNVEELTLNPHGNGTHTECVGHISKEKINITECFEERHFNSVLITETVELNDEGNQIIKPKSLLKWLESNENKEIKALVLRTIPNDESKKTKNHSGAHSAFLSHEFINTVLNAGIDHLLIDLPSVDFEEDPKLTGHHLFFNYPSEINKGKSITELIFAPDELKDGIYLLNLNLPSIETDAVPSNPVLFPIIE